MQVLCQSTWQNNKYPKPVGHQSVHTHFERLSLAYSYHTTVSLLNSGGTTKPGEVHLMESNDSSVIFLSVIPERVFTAALGSFSAELFFSKHSGFAHWQPYG